MSDFGSEWQQLRQSSLTRNALWLFGGQGTSMLCQALYFALVAHLLHAAEYGIYVGALATVAILSQYSSLGSHSVLLRYVSTDNSVFGSYWGNVLVTTFSLGSLLVGALVFFGPYIAHSYSRPLLFYVAVSECIFVQVVLASARVFQAFEKMRFTALLNLATSALRATLAAILLWSFHKGTALDWARAACVVSCVSCVVSLALVTHLFGPPKFAPTLLKAKSGECLVFALSYSTSGMSNDIDKALLGHFGMNAVNGIYTLAYRVTDSATMPIISIQAALFPRLFRAGVGGIQETIRLSLSVLKGTVPISLLCTLAIVAVAPFAATVLGPGFNDISFVLRWLALLPLIRSIQISGGDALTGAGHQTFRLVAQSAAAMFNLSMNIFLIPRYSWHGAAFASLATDSLLALGNWMAVVVLFRRTKHVRREISTD